MADVSECEKGLHLTGYDYSLLPDILLLTHGLNIAEGKEKKFLPKCDSKILNLKLNK